MTRLEAIDALVCGTPTPECVDIIKKSGGLTFADGDENLPEGEVMDRWEQLTDENRHAEFVAQFSTSEPERFRHMHDLGTATTVVVTPVITSETLAAAAPVVDEPADPTAPVVRAGMPARAAARVAPTVGGFGGGAFGEPVDEPRRERGNRRDREDRGDRGDRNDDGNRNRNARDGNNRGTSQLELLQRNMQPNVDAARAGSSNALLTLQTTIRRLKAEQAENPDRTRGAYLEWLRSALPPKPVAARAERVEDVELTIRRKEAEALLARAVVGDMDAYKALVAMKEQVGKDLLKEYSEEWQAFYIWLATSTPPDPEAAAKKKLEDEAKAAEAAKKKRLEDEAKAKAAADKKKVAEAAKAEEDKKPVAKAKGLLALLSAHPVLGTIAVLMIAMSICCGVLSWNAPEKKELTPPTPVLSSEPMPKDKPKVVVESPSSSTPPASPDKGGTPIPTYLAIGGVLVLGGAMVAHHLFNRKSPPPSTPPTS